MPEFLPVKGTRDFPPEYAILRERVISILKECFQIFSYDPIITPIVENFELYRGKSGEEIEKKLIWRFKLPYSDREYALRPELTPSLVRFYSRFRPRLPFKRYEIGRVYRYDDPQKGRYREFWQADFDVIGGRAPEADAEVLNLVIFALKRLGFKNFVLRVNSRILLREIFENFFKIEEEKVLKVYREIDKLDKLGKQKVLENLAGILEEEKAEKIVKLFDCSFDEIKEKFDEEKIGKEIKNLEDIFDLVEDKDKIRFDLSLVRGLDYYTGFVFEAWLEGFNRSVAGGGRYDNLIELFTGKKTLCVGGCLGIEPLIDVGLEKGIFNLDRKTYAEIAVVYVREEFLKDAFSLANLLRENNFKVYLDLGKNNFQEQMMRAVEKGIEYAIIVGEKEKKEGKYTLQNLKTKERAMYSLEEILEMLKGIDGVTGQF